MILIRLGIDIFVKELIKNGATKHQLMNGSFKLLLPHQKKGYVIPTK